MRQTELSLNKRDRRMVDEFRSKGLHMAREFNRAHILAALDSQVARAADHGSPECGPDGDMAHPHGISAGRAGVRPP